MIIIILITCIRCIVIMKHMYVAQSMAIWVVLSLLFVVGL